MKKWLIPVVLFMVVALIVGCGPAEPAPAPTPAPTPAPAEPIRTITLQAGKFGTAVYIWGMAMEDASQEHTWLRVNSMESPGAVWVTEYLLTYKDARKETVGQANDLIRWMALNGKVKYEEPMEEAANLKFVVINAIPAYTFLTFDPNIKTVYDLDGKSVGMGTKGQIGYWLLPQTVLETMGIHPKYSNLGTNPAVKALIDGKVDAAIFGSYTKPPKAEKIEPGPPLMEVEATGRDFYLVSWTEKVVEAATKSFVGWKMNAFEIAPLTISKFQTEPIWGIGHRAGYLAHSDLPEDMAYEFTKIFIKHYEEFFPRHATLETMIPEGILLVDQADIHPGALKAYQEAGIIK